LDGIARAVSSTDFLRMAVDDNDDFRIRMGRSRSRGTRVDQRARSFVGQVNIAVRKAGGDPNRIVGSSAKGSGRFNARGRGARIVDGWPRERDGWSRDASGARFRSRRVIVKARVVKFNPQRGSRGPKMRGMAAKAVDAHLRYLERDGVTRDGEKGRVYSAGEDEADGRAFIVRGRKDRHQFRLIVAPEDSVEMGDLRGFTRDLMRQQESDLGTKLDWVAVDHYNTGHPHTHVIVRGITDDGKILNIAGDYIAHGIRHRASELVTLELGPQTELDVVRKLASEVDAERLTRLDRMLIAEQGEYGLVDLRPNASDSYPIRANRHLLIDRAKRLERYGIAHEIEPGRWTLTAGAEDMRDMLCRRHFAGRWSETTHVGSPSARRSLCESARRRQRNTAKRVASTSSAISWSDDPPWRRRITRSVSGNLRSAICLRESPCSAGSAMLCAGLFWEDQNAFEGAVRNRRLCSVWSMADHLASRGARPMTALSNSRGVDVHSLPILRAGKWPFSKR
jgi:type IV secretory pathway VirD2 relaxase